MLARKIDHIISEPKLNFLEWEISEPDVLQEHNVSVSIIAFEGSGIVGADAERPYLEFLNCNLPVVALNQSDLVQEPVRARLVGQILDAVGKQHMRVDGMTVIVIRAGELLQVGFRELRCVVVTASSISDPRSGGEEERGPKQPSEAVIAFWGDRIRAGEPQSVIDRGAASAKAFSPPLVRGVARKGRL